MRRNIKSNKAEKAIALVTALLPLTLLAQNEAAQAAPVANGSNEMLWYSIYTIMGLLLIVIMVLGNVLINMVKLTIDKQKVKAAAMLLLLFVSGIAFGQEATPVAKAAASSGLAENWTMIMAATVLGTELFVVVVLILLIRNMLNKLVPQKEKVALKFKFPKLLDNFNASVAIENEKDILLDHNYDGIKELNNDLPPWWKYSFIISIFWAIGYMSYYHLMGGPSSHDEYITSMRQAKEQQEEYARANAGKVDESNLKIADAAGIAEGKDIFITNCTPCHGKNAEGGVVGPNLTDDYWLHGGDIKDVFKTIKLGWPAKGMKSWATDLSPSQIKNVASYIKSLHGTNPANAKAPQGDLYNDGGTIKNDSTNVVVKDTAHVKSI